jgi:serine/threonine protein kinase
VFAAKHRVLGHNVAVKALTKADIFRKNYMNFEEYHVLTLLRYRHPSIINMIDAFETDDNLYFIMDYCHGGELFDLIRHRCTSKTCISSESNDSRTTQTMTEQEIIHIIKQLLSAVHFLHSHGIVHRDIKPENILLSNRAPEDLSVKLVDFGLAKTFKDIKNEDVTLDMYGVGLCLLFMMTGSLATNHLFTQSHPGHEHISKAWMDTLSQNLTHYYSDAMMDLLTQLLQHRLSAAEALEHVCMRARI